LITPRDTSTHHFDTLKYFYSKRNFSPIFIKSFEEKDFLYSILITFKKAEEHGLDPEYYHYSLISEEYLKSIKDTTETKNRHSSLANVELLVCDAIVKYSYHMRYGILNPKEIFPDGYFLPITDMTVSFNICKTFSQGVKDISVFS
jgi:hypothetical protein